MDDLEARVLYRARMTAKMAMKKGRIERLLKDFEDYSFLGPKEAGLRETAYQKGVVYCMELAYRKQDYDPQRSRKLYAMAAYNAHLLGREIPKIE